MSFSTDFKEEILNNQLDTKAEKLAFISAVIRVNGSIHIDSKSVNLEVESELYSLIRKFSEEIKCLYDFELEIEIIPETNISAKTYKIKLPKDFTKQISNDTGLITYIGDIAVGFSNGVGIELIGEEEIKSYLLGIVACSASVTVPQPSEDNEEIYVGGYHLEMIFSNETLAYDIMNYFAEFDILFKKIERGDNFGLYIKESEMISDFMAFFGGNNAVLEINNIIVARSVRNEINRVNNCMIANIDKSVEAGQRQYLAIKNIESKIGLDKLPEKLKEIALLRLENPDYTLDQIAECCKEQISKSGINHRFRKIMEIAKTLEEKTEEK